MCRIFVDEYGCNSIDIQGGEPTIYPYIFELIRYCNEIGLKPTLITNLIALSNENYAMKFKEAGVYDFLVSLQGIGENYDKVVGKNGAFQKQMQALENLAKLEIPIRVNAVLSNEIINDLNKISKLAIRYNARAVNFIAYNNTGDQKILRDLHKIPYYDIIGEKLGAIVDELESHNIEVNLRFLPFCVVEEKYRKNIQNGLQMLYDNHEWESSSRLWVDRPSQRQANASIEKRKSVYYLSRLKISKIYREVSIMVKLQWFWALVKPFITYKKYEKIKSYQTNILKKLRFYTPNIPKAYGGGWNMSKVEAFYIEQKEISHKISKSKIYHKKCEKCDIKAICDGFYVDFIEEFGSSSIKPIKLGYAVSNPTFYTQHQYKIIEKEEFDWFFNKNEQNEIKTLSKSINQ